MNEKKYIRPQDRSVMNTAMSINAFYCEPCTRDFLTHDGLQSHLRSSKHYRKQIELDGYQIESNSTLKNRHDQVHTQGGPYCSICKRIFNTNSGFLAHVKMSKSHGIEVMRLEALMPGTLGKQLWPCEFCGYIFPTKEAFEEHWESLDDHRIELHSRRWNSIVQAQEVEESFPLAMDAVVARSQALYTTSNETSMAPAQLASRVLYCDVCERQFNSEKSLESHFEKSKVHKKEVKRRAKEMEKAAMMASDTSMGSSMHFRGHPDFEEAGSSSNMLTSTSTAPHIYPSVDREEPKLTIGLSVPACRVGFIDDGRRSIGKDGIGQESKFYPSADQQQPTLATAKVSGYFSVQDANDDGKRGARKDSHERWSSIRVSEQLIEFQALKESCHSLFDLQKNQYLLYPFGPDDIAGLRRCKNCNGTF